MKAQAIQGKPRGRIRRIGDEPKPSESVWSYKQTCLDPAHKMPGYAVMRPGVYKYECPSCGEVTRFTVRKGMTL